VLTLDTVPVGTECIVKQIGGKGKIRTRILDMGLTRGTQVKVIRVAPFGDPIEFEVRGYNLSLRKEEARQVMVQELHDAA